MKKEPCGSDYGIVVDTFLPVLLVPYQFQPDGFQSHCHHVWPLHAAIPALHSDDFLMKKSGCTKGQIKSE